MPAIPWLEFQSRLPTDEEIEKWFGRGRVNLAVVTGALSQVVVIDADSPEAMRWAALNLPYTHWQTLTAHGYHLWYRHPGIPVPNRARIDINGCRIAIDVRGDGGYVIAPGSVHMTGIDYREAGDWTLPGERLPVFSPSWVSVRRHRRLTKPDSGHSSGSRIASARRYLAAISPPEIGQGSDSATFYAACRLVRGFALKSSDAEMLLWQWAGGRPGWSREWVATKVAHAERYGSEPIGVYR